MLPVAVAAREHQLPLVPDDLGTELEVAGREAVADNARIKPCMPDIGNVARATHRDFRRARRLVGIGQALGLVRGECGQLVIGKTGEPQIEVEGLQIGQLDPEQFGIPAGVERQLVVGDDIGPLLRLALAPGDHGRDLRQAELSRGKQPAMPGDQAAVLVDQHRGWSSPTRGSRRRSAPPVRPSACARCARKA